LVLYWLLALDRAFLGSLLAVLAMRLSIEERCCHEGQQKKDDGEPHPF
jgi:hypothetical protein